MSILMIGFDMYKIYIMRRRKGGSDILKEKTTQTPSFEAAKTAFLEIRKETEFEGGDYVLLMSKDRVKLNVHLFTAEKDDPAFFDLDNIFWFENKHLES